MAATQVPRACSPTRQLGHSSIQITVDLYGHFVPGGDRHHAEGLAAAIEAERVAAEARVLSPHPESVPAPDGGTRTSGRLSGARAKCVM